MSLSVLSLFQHSYGIKEVVPISTALWQACSLGVLLQPPRGIDVGTYAEVASLDRIVSAQDDTSELVRVGEDLQFAAVDPSIS